MVQKRRVPRRDAEARGVAVWLDALERLAGVEPGQERETAADAHAAVEPASQPEHMEQWQRPQRDRGGPGVDEVDGDLSRRAQVAVRQLGALGCTGRPGGVK